MSVRIFLSHAWRDKRTATFKRIETALREDGYDVWVDKREMDLGDDMGEGIRSGIARSDLVLALWSADHLASSVCQSEIDRTLELRKPLVILRLDETDPTRDGRFEGRMLKYLDFRDSPDYALLQLKQFLLRVRQRGSEVLRENADLANRMDALNHMLAEIEDVQYRRAIGATGNEASDAYIEAMVLAGQRLIETSGETPPDEKARLHAFMERAREISAAHPDADADELKKSLLRAAIDEVDADARSPLLQSFAQALDGLGIGRPEEEPAATGGGTVTDPLRGHIERIRSRSGSAESLRNHIDQLLGAYVSGQRAEWERALNAAIDAIPAIVEQLAAAAAQAGVDHLLAPLLEQVAGYFLSEHDVVPDHHGALGLLDDAYLAHAFLLHVNAVYHASTGRPLLFFDPSPTVEVLRRILGPQVTGQLDQWVMQGVDRAVAQSRFEELTRWNGSLGSGAGRTGGPGSWGGAWEDEMARMGAELGISFS